MHEIDLAGVDLNLLVVFDALLRERHVGRAARRLSLSQSATSHALGRLRTALDDPLFVRHPRGIEPTARARELAQPLSEALAQVRQILRPPPAFDPATLRRTFTVAAHDYALAVLLPALTTQLQEHAPAVNLRCVSVHPSLVVDGLDRGELDIALGGLVDVTAARVTRTPLFADRFVGVARLDHPRLDGDGMSLEDFTALPHVLLSPDGRPRGDVDEALEKLNHTRRIAATVPNFLTLPYVVEQSDLIGVLPERLALRAAQNRSLTLFDLPIDVDAVTCSLFVPAPLAATAEIAWLTDLCQNAADPLPRRYAR